MKRPRAWRRACALAALSVACSPKHSPPSPTPIEHAAPRGAATSSGAVPSSSISTAPSASSATSCADPSPATLSVEAVTAFAERWRQTQRSRDFSGYSALYAEHFSGLLGDGASFTRVNRAAWLRTHQGSLTLSAELVAATTRVAIGAGGAQVRFASNAKEPVALPELFVVATSAGLQIMREAPARPAPSELAGPSGPWLADERFAVLSTRPDARWLDGAPTFDGNGTALSNVVLARLPKVLRGWLGRPVRVLGASGTVCETRLQRFAIRSQITPDLASAERWDGCGDDPISPARIAAEIVALTADEGRALVAEFATPCKGALFATDPNLPAPALAAPEPAPAELGERAFAALRASPRYASVQARFKRDHPDAEGAWEDHDGRRSVWALTLPGEELVLASVAAGSGCEGFSASVSAVWRVNGSALTLFSELNALDDHRVSPRALLDLGGETPALLLGPDGDYRAISLVSGSNHGARLLASAPFFAGPC